MNTMAAAPAGAAIAPGAAKSAPYRSLLPAKLPALVPESELLLRLHELESQVDTMLHQHRVAFFKATSTNQTLGTTAKLRVYIYTTQHPASGSDPACWALHVQGRLLDLEDNEISTIAGIPTFTALIRNLDIEFEKADGSPLDPEAFGGPTAINWKRYVAPLFNLPPYTTTQLI